MISDILKDISPRIVHKENDNDVLIYNSRPAVPSFLEPEVIGNIKTNLPDDYYKKLLGFYKFTGEKYVLNTLLQNVSPQMFNDVTKITNNLSNVNFEDYYKKCDDKYTLSNRWIPEFLEKTFSKAFGLEDCEITGKERCEISDILSKSNIIEQNTDEYYTLFNDAKNYFFYSKHHEHVPGLMLIEAARQCMYVHFYKHSGHNRGEVTISILDLNCKFPNYTEACYTVEIVVKDLEIDQKEKCKNGTKVAQFFQNNMLVAEVALKYVVIPMPIFNRMRNIKIPENYWFVPLKNLKQEVLLVGENNIQIQAELQFISINELKLMITTDLSKYNTNELQLKNCIINVSEHGLIYMGVDHEKSLIFPDNKEAIVSFVPVDRKQKDLITKILKDYCYFVKEKSHSTTPDEKLEVLEIKHA